MASVDGLSTFSASIPRGEIEDQNYFNPELEVQNIGGLALKARYDYYCIKPPNKFAAWTCLAVDAIQYFNEQRERLKKIHSSHMQSRIEFTLSLLKKTDLFPIHEPSRKPKAEPGSIAMRGVIEKAKARSWNDARSSSRPSRLFDRRGRSSFERDYSLEREFSRERLEKPAFHALKAARMARNAFRRLIRK